MRSSQGYVTIVDPAVGTVEVDTFTCGHCQRIVQVPPRADAADLGGLCKICDTLVCPACNEKGVCDPYEEKMRRVERAADFAREFEALT